MKTRIFINQWLAMKPYTKQTPTDSYYLKLSNDVKSVLMGYTEYLLQNMKESDIDIMSCFLASYFEDVISKTNIWSTFIKKHSSLYNKKLPFYKMDLYTEDEVHIQDVVFLIWYFLNTKQEEVFVNPYYEILLDMASEVYEIFDEDYEYAPENEYLKNFYQIDKTEKDFYVVRQFIDAILFNTYLFFSDTSLKLQNKERALIETKHEDLKMLINENRDAFLHSTCTRLLSLKGKEWAAGILGEDHPLSADLLNMSQKITGYFLYKRQDKDDIFLEHIASGKAFKITKKSYDHYERLKVTDTIVFFGIVQWQNEWWFSGISFITPFDADLILDEKNSLKSRIAVDFLDYKDKDVINLLKNQNQTFLKYNKGYHISFMPSDQIQAFTNDFLEYYNKSLNLTEKEIEESEKRLNEEGYFGGKEITDIDLSDFESGAVFFNPNGGCEIAMDINSAFPLENNPFYNVAKSEEHIMNLFMFEDFSTEMAKFCIENCSDKLPFLKNGIGKKLLDDIDFLLRFWKKDSYHTKPAITVTGKED